MKLAIQIAVGLAALGLSLLPAPAADACPCVTPAGSSTDEVAQRALVAVSQTGLDYVVQIAVSGDATELAWLIPTPAVPDAPTLLAPEFFQRLDELTNPLLVGCYGGLSCGDGDDLGNHDVTVWSQGTLETLDFAVLSATDGSDLLSWLQDQGYPINSALQDRVTDYAARGWAFVALKVNEQALHSPDSILGPVAIHIPYVGPAVFPLGMSALSQNERLQLVLYVAAEEVLSPQNYQLVEFDPEAGGDATREYSELAREAIDQAGGGFVVEYAGEAPGLSFASSAGDELLTGKKLVRLFTDMEPSLLQEDVVMEADTSLSTSNECRASRKDGDCAAIALFDLTPLGLVALGLLVSRLRRHRRSQKSIVQ